MLALIAGTGDLPIAIAARLTTPYLVCAMQGFKPEIPVDLTFRIEHLGTLLRSLQDRGVTQVCMAGAVRRPPVDPSAIDAATAPLVPRIQMALTSGDDGALRVIMAIFEEAGIEVVAAHSLLPDLIPDAGVLTVRAPNAAQHKAALAGDAALADMGARDSGQACVIAGGDVVLREDAQGTDALMQRVRPEMMDAFLMKGPKPAQDLRADMPVIGLDTARNATAAGLDGIVVEAGGVMVMDLPQIIDHLNAQDRFLWVRPRGGE
ncbi:MAG: UDP-2,3-diacylglucosamine diphosphatase LpxI [Pseudomonadota bacterium]